MTARHRASAAAFELIKRFEGRRLQAVRLDDGGWMIGYGHTRSAREGARVSPADAEALLLYDVSPIAEAIDALTYTPLTQNQFDALTAFVFNIGLENFRRSSVLRLINGGDLIGAAHAMEMWRKADIDGQRMVIDALVRRRAAEKALFLTPADGWIAAPSAVLPPRLDHDIGQGPVRASSDTDMPIRERAETPWPAAPSDDEAPASRAAAEALSARLSALVPEETEEPMFIQAEPDDAPGDDAAPAYLAQSAASETLAGPIPAPEGAAEDAIVFSAPPLAWRETPKKPRRKREGPMTAVALGLLFVFGLALFGAAMLAGLGGRASAQIAGGLDLQDTGPLVWGLGALGAACISAAIYATLRRLGGRDD